MEVALELAGIALTAFLSTNVDNLLLLTVLLSQSVQAKHTVFIGYVGAVLVVVAAGLIASSLADAVPNEWLGYLGIVPLAMGLYRLGKVFRSNSNGNTPVVAS
jgi:cadmium resistance protein CadD (predicted permease)